MHIYFFFLLLLDLIMLWYAYILDYCVPRYSSSSSVSRPRRATMQRSGSNKSLSALTSPELAGIGVVLQEHGEVRMSES